MSFDPGYLPPALQTCFKQGPMYWMAAVQRAKEDGYHHVDVLTDMVFHMHHPELHNRNIRPAEDGLIKEWKAFHATIKSMIGYKKPAPNLSSLLAKVEVAALGTTIFHQAALGGLRAFFARALAGNKLDDGYWRFEPRDNFGRPFMCSRPNQVHSFVRQSKLYAFKRFKELTDGATTSGEVGKALKDVEGSLSCHTYVPIRWARLNGGISEAAVKAFTEYRYLKDLVLLSRNINHVYNVYQFDLEKQYYGISKAKPRTFPWQ